MTHARNNNYAKRPAPKGLDFVPVEGGPKNLTFGVVRRQITQKEIPMLVVRAEIWPGGDESYAYSVGEIIAANESSRSPVSSYSVSIRQEPAHHIGIEGWERELSLANHTRRKGV